MTSKLKKLPTNIQRSKDRELGEAPASVLQSLHHQAKNNLAVANQQEAQRRAKVLQAQEQPTE